MFDQEYNKEMIFSPLVLLSINYKTNTICARKKQTHRFTIICVARKDVQIFFQVYTEKNDEVCSRKNFTFTVSQNGITIKNYTILIGINM